MTPATVTRRGFLHATGLAAIVAAIAQADPAHAEPLGGYPPLPSPVQQIFDSVRRASHEALTGVAAMVMPGDDAYSRAQRVTARGPGAVSDDSAVQFIALIDRFLPQADALVRPIAVALSTTLADLSVPAAQFPEPATARAIDRALGVGDNDRTFPLSLAAGLVLNVSAVLAGGRFGAGPFASPFANADFDTKCRAFELIEQPAADLLAVFDSALPQPLRGSGSGLLRFVGGILLDGAAFTVWSEHRLYDVATRRLRRRPAAWDITNYRPHGIVDGHDEFRGYYRGMEDF